MSLENETWAQMNWTRYLQVEREAKAYTARRVVGL